MALIACRASWVALCLVLAACSTTPDPEPGLNAPASTVTWQPVFGLAAQTLEPGECGLFGWDTSSPPAFVFFATAQRALYLSPEGNPERLTPIGPFPSEDYGALTLILGAAEPLIAGTRYAQARVTQVLDDGFIRVRPLVILRSCQTLENSPELF